MVPENLTPPHAYALAVAVINHSLHRWERGFVNQRLAVCIVEAAVDTSSTVLPVVVEADAIKA